MRVAALAAELATELGLTTTDVDDIRRAAPLHDVGKIGVPDDLLRKPRPLSPEEVDVMRTHTTIGADILRDSSIKVLQVAREIALTHHERWDGTGYPNRLAGEDIPLPGRIVAVADAYDAITNDRPYRAARSPREAIDRDRAPERHAIRSRGRQRAGPYCDRRPHDPRSSDGRHQHRRNQLITARCTRCTAPLRTRRAHAPSSSA